MANSVEPLVQHLHARPPQVEPKRVRKLLRRALEHGPMQDGPIAETAQLLAERLEEARITPERILLLGSRCHTLQNRIAQLWPKAHVTTLTLEPGWAAALRPARKKLWQRRSAPYLTAHPDQLPFANGTFDIVISNLTLHWSMELSKGLGEARRVLRGNGWFHLTLPGHGNLYPLRQAMMDEDQARYGRSYSRMPEPLDIQTLGDRLVRAGFTLPVSDREGFMFELPNLPTLLEMMAELGSGNPYGERPPGLGGRGYLQAVESRLRQQQGAGPDAPLQLPMELLFAAAWKAADPGGNNLALPKQEA
uniref:Putative SAM-dependent methyltransferase n=1 Tax=Magnetococcus massalia (strain MO-1) TaxID=451514 RepID=A0A1S7LIJ5_MAGMO|nr:putative SAM-dependent methyltransferase [Candidatus Magnetococcus massalia]